MTQLYEFSATMPCFSPIAVQVSWLAVLRQEALTLQAQVQNGLWSSGTRQLGSAGSSTHTAGLLSTCRIRSEAHHIRARFTTIWIVKLWHGVGNKALAASQPSLHTPLHTYRLEMVRYKKACLTKFSTACRHYQQWQVLNEA